MGGDDFLTALMHPYFAAFMVLGSGTEEEFI